MSPDDEFYPTIYTLEDEDGNELQLELLDTVDLDDNTYYAMIPYHENIEELCDDDGDLIVLKSEMVGEEEMLSTINDEEEYQKVGQFMLERVTAMFEGEEEEEEEETHSDCE